MFFCLSVRSDEVPQLPPDGNVDGLFCGRRLSVEVQGTRDQYPGRGVGEKSRVRRPTNWSQSWEGGKDGRRREDKERRRGPESF